MAAFLSRPRLLCPPVAAYYIIIFDLGNRYGLLRSGGGPESAAAEGAALCRHKEGMEGPARPAPMPERGDHSMEPKTAIQIDDVIIHLPKPTELPVQWVGQEEVMKQVLAAWMVLDEADLPLNPRLIGKPGVGKTTLAYAAAKRSGRAVYLFQATMDTRPEDLVVTPVIGPHNDIQYIGSSVVAAAVNGGVCILDEGNRMSEKAWASLAPLLDVRRYLESLVAGVKIHAHPEFRFVTTMNDDASTYDLPEYIHSRLQPQIYIDFPEEDEEKRILQANVPFADREILAYVLGFLRRAHEARERYTVRDGINVARYAMKLMETETVTSDRALDVAIRLILGEEALPYAEP